MYIVISCSLNSDSKSRLMARTAMACLEASGHEATLIDLQDWCLPYCDGQSDLKETRVPELKQCIEAADGLIIAAPIYNYDVSALTKGMIELTGNSWTKKIVGFLCAAGGQGSYMSILGLANSLMLDFRCLVIPRFVYADSNCFGDGKITDPAIKERLAELTQELVFTCSRLTTAQL